MLAADLDCGLLGFEACILSCCPSIEQDGSVYPPRAKGLHNDLATNLVVVVEHAWRVSACLPVSATHAQSMEAFFDCSQCC